MTEGGLRVPQWLLSTIAVAVLGLLLTLGKLVALHNTTNDLQDQRLGRIEEVQVVARGVIEREDVRDRALHEELARLRERMARLERNGGQH